MKKTELNSKITTSGEGTEPGELEKRRWDTLSRFGLDRPSGSLGRDLEEDKKILLQRGVRIRETVVEKDMGEGVIQFIACTDGVKRDGNRVRNDGWSFTNFEKNPQFLWCHDYHSLPIGKHIKWEIAKDGDESVLRLWSQFCSADLYPFADKVRQMYQGGFLRAGSVGWIPLEWEPLKDEEGRTVGFDFTRNELLEFSAVPVPSDPDAIVEAVQRGVVNSEDVESFMRSGLMEPQQGGLFYTLSYRDADSDICAQESLEVETTESEGTEEVDELLDGLTGFSEEEINCSGEADQGEVSIEEETREIETDHSEVSIEEEVREIEEDQGLSSELNIETGIEDESDVESEEDLELEYRAEGDEMEEAYANAQKLVTTIQEASSQFADSIIAAVMAALGESGDRANESESRESEEIDNIETPVSVDIDPEVIDPDLVEEIITQSLQDGIAMSRVGAKVSKRMKDRLCRCRDMLIEVTDSINEIMDEEKSDDKDDDNMSKDLEVANVESSESASHEVEESEEENAEAKNEGIDILSSLRSIQDALGLLTDEHRQCEDDNNSDSDSDSTDESMSKILHRIKSLGDEIGNIENDNSAPGSGMEPKSDYVRGILEKIRGKD